ncbi:MAG: POTRA domain-containing protein, partial [Planctomycetota bacterium]
MAVSLPVSVRADDTSPDGMMIEALDVAGNVTLTRSEILSVVRTRPGQVLNSEIVDEDILRIAKLGAVESAYYNTRIENNRVVLTYVVVEHNLVRSIAFKGNKKLKDGVLRKELS